MTINYVVSGGRRPKPGPKLLREVDAKIVLGPWHSDEPSHVGGMTYYYIAGQKPLHRKSRKAVCGEVLTDAGKAWARDGYEVLPIGR